MTNLDFSFSFDAHQISAQWYYKRVSYMQAEHIDFWWTEFYEIQSASPLLKTRISSNILVVAQTYYVWVYVLTTKIKKVYWYA